MVVIGSAIIVVYTVSFSIVDKEVPTTKLCTHESNEELQIKLRYMVIQWKIISHKQSARWQHPSQ
jgi:hypothetical protein